jgi:hypothetical protein
MPLEQAQMFITKYLRDPRFRERYRSPESKDVEVECNLSKDDLDLVRQIDLDDLDRAAVGMRDERRTKRESEFQQFVDHLAVYTAMDPFFEQYDRAYPDGMLTRPQEMDRFLDFGTCFVLGNGLPPYLIDLLRFCYHYVKLSDTPLDRSAPVLAENPESLRPFHRLQLQKPYRILDFPYDVLWLARQTPDSELASVPPLPVRLFLQKNWSKAKETQIFYASEIPVLPSLAHEPVAVIDLLALIPASAYPDAVAYLEELVERRILGVLS